MLGCALLFTFQASEAHAALSSDVIAKAAGVFFKDTPVMVAIARCESEMRQYDDTGKVLRGGSEGHMIGLFQLHEVYHRDEALTRGYDIDTLIGNMAYARDLYREEGTTPWDPSSDCWGDTVVVVSSSTATTNGPLALAATRSVSPVHSSSTLITKTLAYSMTDPEVRTLQKALNGAGYRVTTLGEETNYFGVATYKALIRFQCDHDLACATRPGTLQNVGRVDATTRAVINRQNSVVG